MFMMEAFTQSLFKRGLLYRHRILTHEMPRSTNYLQINVINMNNNDKSALGYVMACSKIGDRPLLQSAGLNEPHGNGTLVVISACMCSFHENHWLATTKWSIPYGLYHHSTFSKQIIRRLFSSARWFWMSLDHRGEAMYISMISFQWTNTETKSFQ